jgi:hypothetical protein
MTARARGSRSVHRCLYLKRERKRPPTQSLGHVPGNVSSVGDVTQHRPQMTDDKLDEVILGGLRIMREGLRQGAWNISTMTVAGIAAMVDQPVARVESRVAELAARGLIKESEAAPGRWMIGS